MPEPAVKDKLIEWMKSVDFDLWELFLTIGAIVFALSVVWSSLKRFWPSLKKFIRFVEAMFALPDFIKDAREALTKQERVLEVVKHEVLPNNGGSLRDEVTTQGLRLEKLEAKMMKNFERVRELEHELEVREATKRSASVLTPGGLSNPHVEDVDCADSYNPYPIQSEE